jgi:Alb1
MAPRNDAVSQPLLAARPGAGVTKKKSSKRGNAKTRGQKLRQERGLQRAEAVMDQLEKKVKEAREREGKRRERRKVWDEVNSGVTEIVGRRGKEKFGGNPAEEWEDVGGDGDEEMVGAAEALAEAVVGPTESTAPVEPAEPVVLEAETLVVVDHTTSLNGVEFEDEIT